MKDIGLGILDPYTVIIVFVVLVLAQVLFGHPIPFDLSNASQLFAGLVLFTGYLYAAQSLVRLPIATIAYRIWIRKTWKLAEEFETDQRGLKRIKRNLQTSGKLLKQSPLFMGYWFLFVTNFTGEFNEHRKEIGIFASLVIAILDRLFLVLIVFLTVLPQFKAYFQLLAIAGLFLMIVVFVFKGSFVALVNDEIRREEEKEPKFQEITSPVSKEKHQKQLSEQISKMIASQENARAATQPDHRDTISGEVEDGNNTFG